MFFEKAQRIAAASRNDSWLVRWGRVMAVVIMIIGGLDLVSTNVALAAGHFEANPMVRWFQDIMGEWWSIPKMTFHLLLASLVIWIPSKRMLATGVIVSVAYILLFANNMYHASQSI